MLAVDKREQAKRECDMNDHRPRQRAAEILLLPPAARAAAIAAIKGDAMRSTVQFYVEDHERRIQTLVLWVSAGKTRVERNQRLGRVPETVREEVRQRVEEVFKERVKKP